MATRAEAAGGAARDAGARAAELERRLESARTAAGGAALAAVATAEELRARAEAAEGRARQEWERSAAALEEAAKEAEGRVATEFETAQRGAEAARGSRNSDGASNHGGCDAQCRARARWRLISDTVYLEQQDKSAARLARQRSRPIMGDDAGARQGSGRGTTGEGRRVPPMGTRSAAGSEERVMTNPVVR